MSVRHIGLATALTLAACGHVPQTLPSAQQLGSETHHRSSPLVSRKWYVDGVHGRDRNDCESRQHACKTISHAISLTSRGDSVIVAAAVYSDNLNIPHSVDIAGSGIATTIIDGGGVASVIISSNPGDVVTVSGVTMRNGSGGAPGDGGGIYNCNATLTIVDSVISGSSVTGGRGNYGYGGAIYNCPGTSLTIVNSTISGNTAESGGAICNGGTLTISNSTFSGNVARRYRGGAIFNYGTLTINNSTFSGNSVPRGSGGAIHNGQLFGKGILAISNSTLSGNTASEDNGGGIYNLNGATAALQNTIVSNNKGRNCSGMLTSRGYNLSSDNTCKLDHAGDLNNTDPKLGSLQDNGGPTQTMALHPASPAIDAGNPSGCTDGQGHLVVTDQRGEPRPDTGDSGGCDMGAYERQNV